MTPTRLTDAQADTILTLQLACAWAGEGDTEPPRLGWWRTAMVDEYGGADLLRLIAPQTWRWATLQAAREAARRADARARARAADPDDLVTLFRFSFAVDEQLDDRLRDLKTAGVPPEEALPSLAPLLADGWDAARFDAWLPTTGAAPTVTTLGRELPADPATADATGTARRLAAALRPLAADYPVPYLRTA